MTLFISKVKTRTTPCPTTGEPRRSLADHRAFWCTHATKKSRGTVESLAGTKSSHQGIALPSQLSKVPLCFSERTGSTDNSPRTLVSTVRSACKGQNETAASFETIQQHPPGSCALRARLLPPRVSREPWELGRVHCVGGWLGICTAGLDGGGLG